jgi:hypothetical protein
VPCWLRSLAWPSLVLMVVRARSLAGLDRCWPRRRWFWSLWDRCFVGLAVVGSGRRGLGSLLVSTTVGLVPLVLNGVGRFLVGLGRAGLVVVGFDRRGFGVLLIFMVVGLAAVDLVAGGLGALLARSLAWPSLVLVAVGARSLAGLDRWWARLVLASTTVGSVPCWSRSLLASATVGLDHCEGSAPCWLYRWWARPARASITAGFGHRRLPSPGWVPVAAAKPVVPALGHRDGLVPATRVAPLPLDRPPVPVTQVAFTATTAAPVRLRPPDTTLPPSTDTPGAERGVVHRQAVHPRICRCSLVAWKSGGPWVHQRTVRSGWGLDRHCRWGRDAVSWGSVVLPRLGQPVHGFAELVRRGEEVDAHVLLAAPVRVEAGAR